MIFLGRTPCSLDDQMHHVPNWMETLAELDRVLPPGGYLIDSSFVIPTILVGAAQELLGGHMGFPTKNQINTKLTKRAYAAIYIASPGSNFTGIFKKPEDLST